MFRLKSWGLGSWAEAQSKVLVSQHYHRVLLKSDVVILVGSGLIPNCRGLIWVGVWVWGFKFLDMLSWFWCVYLVSVQNREKLSVLDGLHRVWGSGFQRT